MDFESIIQQCKKISTIQNLSTLSISLRLVYLPHRMKQRQDQDEEEDVEDVEEVEEVEEDHSDQSATDDAW